MTDRCFYSKIILFGEYSMIFDSTALMIPYRRYKAQWKFNQSSTDSSAISSNRNIKKYYQYLLHEKDLAQHLDMQCFYEDLQTGLYLDSDVPSGYGLGSSGTLVAAVYHRYALHPMEDPMRLKTFFGRMESYFHGSSSGIDPLECYLNKPFKITKTGVQILDNDFISPDIHVFLLDTGIKSNTKPLVQYFKDQRDDETYLSMFQANYVPCVNACINSLIQHDDDAFFYHLRKLSDAQLKYLRPMVTENMVDLFLEEHDFHLGYKILGSGGGGFVLGFTDNLPAAEEIDPVVEIKL